jgi:dipeptide transport system substrate-binding protein
MLTLRRLLLAVGAGILLLSAFDAHARTFVYCSEGDPEGFNPALYTSGTTFDAGARQIFDRLLEFEPSGTATVPGLATAWTISDDGLTYRFTLRRGVRWQTTPQFTPSREFNADDVVFSFNRQLSASHPYHAVGGGRYPYFAAMNLEELLADVAREDDYTVVFRLKRPEAPFLADLAMDFASIQSAEYAERMLRAGTPAEFDARPVGTGPYRLVSYTRGTAIRYAAHPQHWRGVAPSDELVFAITPDPATRYARLRAGECHAMAYPNAADVPAMRGDNRVQVMQSPGLGVSYIALNTQKGVFRDVRVRRALNLAIDRDAIIRGVFNGDALPASNPLPPSVWSFDRTIPVPRHDPALASVLLSEAGVAIGTKVTLWAMPVSRPYNPNARLMAELVQADLAKIGLTAEIVTYEWADYLRRSAAGEHEMLNLGWISDNGDPDNFLTPTLSCAAAATGENRARWCNERFDALLQEAATTSDRARRTLLYRQAQAIFAEELPWIPIAYPPDILVMRAGVTGYQPSAFGLHSFYGAVAN